MGSTLDETKDNRRRVFWFLRVLASAASGIAAFTLLSRGFLFFPGLEWYISLPVSVWVAFTVYSPRAMALVFLTPLLVYRVVKALRRMNDEVEEWTSESPVTYADSFVLLEEELDEKSFIVSQAVRMVVKNVTGKEPNVVAVVSVADASAPSVYISSPDDALIGEDIEDLLEEAVESYTQKSNNMALKLYELENGGLMAVLVMPQNTYEELANSLLEADSEHGVEVEGGSRLLEILYGLVREAVVQSSPEEVGKNKPLVAYLTIKQIDKLEKKGFIKLSGRAKNMLPLEDSKTRSIVKRQLQEEASDRKRKR